MVKRFLNIGFAFALALSFFIASFALNPKGADAATYDATNPYSTGCAYKSPYTADTKYIKDVNGNTLGYVQLKGSAGCHTAWAYIKLYSAAKWNGAANAYIDRYSGLISTPDGGVTFLSCNSYGGNGWVDAGQTSCYTGQIWDASPYKAQASGYLSPSGYGAKTIWY